MVQHQRRSETRSCLLALVILHFGKKWYVVRETSEGFSGEIQISGRRVTNLRYADVFVLLASIQ